MSRIVLIVSGLPDLITAVAALEHCGYPLERLRQDASVLLLGQRISLPDDLVTAFQDVALRAYGFPDVSVHVWEDGDFPVSGSLAHGSEVLAANQLQARKHRDLIIALKPSAFVFFDNGLSSYADHRIDTPDWMARMPGCRTFRAYLTHAGRLGVPAYLQPFSVDDLPAAGLREAVEPVTRVFVPADTRLGAGSAVIIGTAFSRTGLIAWGEERAAHLALLDAVRATHQGDIWWKAHPRSGPPLLEAADGVRVLDPGLPMEAFVTGEGGSACSFASTTLFTLEDHFGWKANRASHPAMDAVLASRPQLAGLAAVPASLKV